MQRIRIHYKKNFDLRYTGHLDLTKILERYFRRSKLPLAYTEGFHPQPRMNHALPLPLGFLSRSEIIDIWLDTSLELNDIETKLRSTPQPGIEIASLEEIDLGAPKIQNLVSAADYLVNFLDPYSKDDLEYRIQGLLAAENILRKKRTKTYNLRPLIINLYLLPSEMSTSNSFAIQMKLQAKPGATGRPDEVLSQLSIDPNLTRIERIGIILDSGDKPANS